MDALLPLVRAVSGTAPRRAVVIAELPSGSYETSAEHCSQTPVRLMKLEATGDAEDAEGKVHPADVVVRQRVDDEEAFLRLPQCQGAYRVVL
ncbi:beta/alpha barrel domain-containing protein [Streptomyces malaysiensis]|uniref:hypothetical protein n=1 Tax=Streptomyces malaysiensis TaxID=92644 RepID=UPI001AD94A3F|nr:hypothetical protein [Streptomyces malaysiensis]